MPEQPLTDANGSSERAPDDWQARWIADREAHPEWYLSDEEQAARERQEAEYRAEIEADNARYLAVEAAYGDGYQTNEHGVKGQREADAFIPLICSGCDHCDMGECGDYGTRYSWPLCTLGLFFPTRKGTCKKYEPAGTYYRKVKEETDARADARAHPQAATQAPVK